MDVMLCLLIDLVNWSMSFCNGINCLRMWRLALELMGRLSIDPIAMF